MSEKAEGCICIGDGCRCGAALTAKDSQIRGLRSLLGEVHARLGKTICTGPECFKCKIEKALLRESPETDDKVPGASRTPAVMSGRGSGNSPEGDGLPAPTGTTPSPEPETGKGEGHWDGTPCDGKTPTLAACPRCPRKPTDDPIERMQQILASTGKPCCEEWTDPYHCHPAPPEKPPEGEGRDCCKCGDPGCCQSTPLRPLPGDGVVVPPCIAAGGHPCACCLKMQAGMKTDSLTARRPR